MRVPFRLIAFILIVFTSLIGCTGTKRAANNVVQGSIPADITDPKYILLVERDKYVRPSVLETAMKKYYPAAYEIVKAEQLNSDKKYNDVSKYRYLVQFRNGSGGSYSNGQTHVIYSDEFVTDRKENKAFPATNLVAGSYGQSLMLFCRALPKK